MSPRRDNLSHIYKLGYIYTQGYIVRFKTGVSPIITRKPASQMQFQRFKVKERLKIIAAKSLILYIVEKLSSQEAKNHHIVLHYDL